MTRQWTVLISYGFGAGWTSWAAGRQTRELMLTWPPLVAALLGNERVTEDHEAVQSLLVEVERRGLDLPYLGGLDGLTAVQVEGPGRVTEYDGAEAWEPVAAVMADAYMPPTPVDPAAVEMVSDLLSGLDMTVAELVDVAHELQRREGGE